MPPFEPQIVKLLASGVAVGKVKGQIEKISILPSTLICYAEFLKFTTIFSGEETIGDTCCVNYKVDPNNVILKS